MFNEVGFHKRHPPLEHLDDPTGDLAAAAAAVLVAGCNGGASEGNMPAAGGNAGSAAADTARDAHPPATLNLPCRPKTISPALTSYMTAFSAAPSRPGSEQRRESELRRGSELRRRSELRRAGVGCPPGLPRVLQACFAPTPELRPSMADVVAMLADMTRVPRRAD